MHEPNTTLAVQRFIDELRADGATPVDPLIRGLLDRSVRRLQRLCGRFLHRRYPRLTLGPDYIETDDVVAAVAARLIKALRACRPQTAQQFFALANQHIRWELNDLARRVDRQGGAAIVLSHDPVAPHTPTTTPTTTTTTTAGGTPTLERILGAIEGLPEDERVVFESVRIQGLTHAETAELLGVSEKTVQRRLRRGVMLLSARLGDLAPAGENAGVPD